MSKNNQQILIINSLRGIAALAVCLYHFVCTTKGYITDEVLLDIFHYGKKGVQLFFIISGIVIPFSMIKSNYKIKFIGKYLLKRFVRIEPPYLVAVLLGILFLYLRNFIPSSANVDLTPSLRDIALHLGYLVPFFEDAKWINQVFWTLSIEFQYYIFLALLIPLALSEKKIFHWIFSALVISVPFINGSGAFFLHWAPYFGLGIFYVLFISKKYNIYEFVISFLLSSIVIFFEQGILDLMIGLGALSIIHIFQTHKSKIGFFLGDISYSLYLIHSIIGSSLINFLSHKFNSPMGKFGVITLGVFVSIASAYVFWRFIEKPSQARSKKIKIKGN